MTLTVQDASTGESESEKQFQEKMKERMRAAMGDLMPDDVLAGIVARGIDEAFFKKRKRLRSGYHSSYQYEEYEPWVVEQVTKMLEEQVRVHVEKWIATNSEKVAEIVEKSLQGGISAAVVRSMDAIFSSTMHSFQASIQDKLDAISRRLGGQ